MGHGAWQVGLGVIGAAAWLSWPGCTGDLGAGSGTTTAQGGSGAQGGTGAQAGAQPDGGTAGTGGGTAGGGGAGGSAEVGCCTPAGVGCCTEEPPPNDWCHEADECLVSRCRNGQEVCDDEGVHVDPAAFQYFLLCQTGNNGVGYTATISGGPCDGSNIQRCRCWEENLQKPWEMLANDKIAELVCAQVGDRIEVQFPSAGNYYMGVHAQPGDYVLAGHCPGGEGCMTSVALIAIPW
ncbi:MAG: hypothetical protein JRI68_14930 [Deltaproteobacteria bacterium]|nr:hypothetical protein [Deltaproteobacteria bacterium]